MIWWANVASGAILFLYWWVPHVVQNRNGIYEVAGRTLYQFYYARMFNSDFPFVHPLFIGLMSKQPIDAYEITSRTSQAKRQKLSKVSQLLAAALKKQYGKTSSPKFLWAACLRALAKRAGPLNWAKSLQIQCFRIKQLCIHAHFLICNSISNNFCKRLLFLRFHASLTEGVTDQDSTRSNNQAAKNE